jgi:molybdopterin biosynthesis enzyme MoaB
VLTVRVVLGAVLLTVGVAFRDVTFDETRVVFDRVVMFGEAFTVELPLDPETALADTSLPDVVTRAVLSVRPDTFVVVIRD